MRWPEPTRPCTKPNALAETEYASGNPRPRLLRQRFQTSCLLSPSARRHPISPTAAITCTPGNDPGNCCIRESVDPQRAALTDARHGTAALITGQSPDRAITAMGAASNIGTSGARPNMNIR